MAKQTVLVLRFLCPPGFRATHSFNGGHATFRVTLEATSRMMTNPPKLRFPNSWRYRVRSAMLHVVDASATLTLHIGRVRAFLFVVSGLGAGRRHLVPWAIVGAHRTYQYAIVEITKIPRTIPQSVASNPAAGRKRPATNNSMDGEARIPSMSYLRLSCPSEQRGTRCIAKQPANTLPVYRLRE